MNRLILSAVLLLPACASDQDWMQHGVVRSDIEYIRAKAECERRSGGTNYPAAIAACMHDAGWEFGTVPSAGARDRTPTPRDQKAAAQ